MKRSKKGGANFLVILVTNLLLNYFKSFLGMLEFGILVYLENRLNNYVIANPIK